MLEVHVKVHGNVQGVGFRATACTIARKLGVKGVIRNTSDDAVEIIAQGEERALESLLKELGSIFDIGKIEKSFSEPNKIYQGFSISL